MQKRGTKMKIEVKIYAAHSADIHGFNILSR
jgi:hypothetical protein